jgi:hypothetical protein
VRPDHAELQDLGAEVVDVAVQPRLGVEADVELVAATRRAFRLSVTGAEYRYSVRYWRARFT